MKIWILVFCTVLGALTNAVSDDRRELRLSAGYRVDDFDWSISGVTGTPNILSELQWNNVEIFLTRAKGYFENDYVYLKAQGEIGLIYDGDNQDSDYLGNNRSQEFSRSNNDVSGNNAFGLNVGIGHAFELTQPQSFFGVKVAPMVGFAYDVLNLRITDGYQTIPNTGSFNGLNTTYRAEWTSLWVGGEVIISAGDHWEFTFSTQYHEADYDSEADWNLRTDFQHPVSFKNETDGDGIVIDLDWVYKLNKDYSLFFNHNYQKWRGDRGTNTRFLVTGALSISPLNEINWEVRSYNFGMVKHF